MSMSNPVSSQVTDAVTQTNARIQGNAATVSLDSLYVATANALGIAAHDAVAGQQQNAVLMQAATTQAVMQLLSIDGAGKAAQAVEDGSSGVPLAAVTAASTDVAARIKQEVELPNKIGLDNAASWPHVVREIVQAEADALRDLQRVSQEAGMAMVKQAATAAVLVQLIKAPDQLEPYQKILELIEAL